MADNLRDRIAAVLGANSHMSRELQDHLADAVIRELNLAKACESVCVWRLQNPPAHRYVTEWTADE